MNSFKISLIWILLCTLVFAQSFRSKINDGNKNYTEEKYEEALNSYQDALLDDPQNAIAHFNRGDAYYKIEKYDQAIEEYQKALTGKDIALEAKTHYNIGNVYFKQDKLQESIQSYIKSLDLKPDDLDTKYNLEFARAKLKELADKKQSGDNQQQQNIDPSEYAKALKAQAGDLASKRQYKKALDLLNEGLKKDKTVAAYQSFIKRLNDVAIIEDLK